MEWKCPSKCPMPTNRAILVFLVWDDGNETPTRQWPEVIEYDPHIYKAFLYTDSAFDCHGEPIKVLDINTSPCIGIHRWLEIPQCPKY